MKLTDAEMAYTRQVAAEIGADPDTLIAEGETVKAAGYQQAYEASVQIMADVQGVGGGFGNSMMTPAGHPRSWAEAEPDPEAELGAEAGP